ncbi:MAG: hypothetical protein IJT91_04855, partial [Clostridia bacterium]|nr:hypothetical protein [Clostridia bacterium]
MNTKNKILSILLCMTMLFGMVVGMNSAVSAEGEKKVNVKITIDVPTGSEADMSHILDVSAKYFWADKGSDNWTSVDAAVSMTDTNFTAQAEIAPNADQFDLMAAVLVHTDNEKFEYVDLIYGKGTADAMLGILNQENAVTFDSSASEVIITKNVDVSADNAADVLNTPDDHGGIWKIAGKKTECEIKTETNDEALGTVPGDQTVPINTIVKLSAEPKTGAIFVSWKKAGEVVGTKADLYLIACSNPKFAAEFSAVNYTLTTPEVVNKTGTTITIAAVEGHKYSIDGGATWTEVFTEPGLYTFTGLKYKDKKPYKITASVLGSDQLAELDEVYPAVLSIDKVAYRFNVKNDNGEDENLRTKVEGEGLDMKATNPNCIVTIDPQGAYNVKLLVDLNEDNYEEVKTKIENEKGELVTKTEAYSYAPLFVSNGWGQNVTIDLNGHNITAINGNNSHSDGGNGINVIGVKNGTDNFVLTLTNSADQTSTITAGDAYVNSGKNGGNAIAMCDEEGNTAPGAAFILGGKGHINFIGGNGGDREKGDAGNGGNGVEGNVAAIVGEGVSCTGGNGGETFVLSGGNGGSGVHGTIGAIEGPCVFTGGNGGFSASKKPSDEKNNRKGGDGGAAVKNDADNYDVLVASESLLQLKGGDGADGYLEAGKGAEAYKNCKVVNSKGNDGIVYKDIVDTFVKDYLTGEDGKVFSEVTEQNAAKIASGEESWNNLSASAKRIIDSMLGLKMFVDVENVNENGEKVIDKAKNTDSPFASMLAAAKEYSPNNNNNNNNNGNNNNNNQNGGDQQNQNQNQNQ